MYDVFSWNLIIRCERCCKLTIKLGRFRDWKVSSITQHGVKLGYDNFPCRSANTNVDVLIISYNSLETFAIPNNCRKQKLVLFHLHCKSYQVVICTLASPLCGKTKQVLRNIAPLKMSLQSFEGSIQCCVGIMEINFCVCLSDAKWCWNMVHCVVIVSQ